MVYRCCLTQGINFREILNKSQIFPLGTPVIFLESSCRRVTTKWKKDMSISWLIITYTYSIQTHALLTQIISISWQLIQKVNMYFTLNICTITIMFLTYVKCVLCDGLFHFGGWISSDILLCLMSGTYVRLPYIHQILPLSTFYPGCLLFHTNTVIL